MFSTPKPPQNIFHVQNLTDYRQVQLRRLKSLNNECYKFRTFLLEKFGNIDSQLCCFSFIWTPCHFFT